MSDNIQANTTRENQEKVIKNDEYFQRYVVYFWEIPKGRPKMPIRPFHKAWAIYTKKQI
ncbi:hypothetical protein AALC25_08220 [Lachnospiraceae bacterium 29-84]